MKTVCQGIVSIPFNFFDSPSTWGFIFAKISLPSWTYYGNLRPCMNAEGNLGFLCRIIFDNKGDTLGFCGQKGPVGQYNPILLC
jgi:hypothetical protein